MEIPFVDLKTQHRRLLPQILEKWEVALRNASFVGGAEVDGFEEEFAAYCEVAACAGVASGTDALVLAFVALGLKPGDEVITVPNTFIATTEAISQAGGTFRFVDCDPATYTIDVSQIESAITERTVGIVPVHLYGQAADMDPLLEIAARHGLWVVEDAAQAQGARYKGRRCGSMGVMGCFSFYPGKNLGACGEAGAVVSNDAELIQKVRVLRDHGQSEKYHHVLEGYNARLDALQAAVLRIKLRHLDDWNARRRRAAAGYAERLSSTPELVLPDEPEYSEGVYHLYVVRSSRREALREHLASQGVQTGLHYPIPLHLQPAYRARSYQEGEFPVTERLAAEGLSLPMHPELTEEHIDYTAEAVASLFGQPVS